MALGGILIGVALGAKKLVILGGERLVHQGALALEALEAVLVPVTVLVGQILQGMSDSCCQVDTVSSCTCLSGFFFNSITYPGVTANGFLALFTSVGVQALITFHTVGIVLSKNVLFPKQGLLAVVAVVALSHCDQESLT